MRRRTTRGSTHPRERQDARVGYGSVEFRDSRSVGDARIVVRVQQVAPTLAHDTAAESPHLPSAMPFAVSSDRTPSQQFANAFGRLRALLRQHPAPIADVRAQARECGRRAYRAGMRLDILVDLLAGVVPADAYRLRSLPTEMIDAAVESYLVTAEAPAEAGVA